MDQIFEKEIERAKKTNISLSADEIDLTEEELDENNSILYPLPKEIQNILNTELEDIHKFIKDRTIDKL